MNGGRYPGMPFNQQMTFPCDLTLRRGADGLRVYRYPVPEISGLWEKTVSARLGGRHTASVAGQAGSDRVASRLQREAPTSAAQNQTLTVTEIQSELLDVEADLKLDGKAEVWLNGTKIEYDPVTQTLSCLGRTAFLPLEKNRLKLRVLVDRTSVEVFANDGRVSLSTCRMPTTDRRISFAVGPKGEAEATVRSLKSAWRS